MKRVLRQYENAVIGGMSAVIVMGIFTGTMLSGGMSRLTHLFSDWLYG